MDRESDRMVLLPSRQLPGVDFEMAEAVGLDTQLHTLLLGLRHGSSVHLVQSEQTLNVDGIRRLAMSAIALFFLQLWFERDEYLQ